MAKSPLSVDLAWQHHRAGRFAEAERMYRMLLKKNPRNADVMRLLGNALRRMNRLSESVAILEKAARLRPHKTNIQLEYGTALAQSGRMPDAIACFRRCIELEPKQPDHYLRLAQVYLTAFEVTTAIEILEQGLAAAPGELAIHKALGDALSTQGRFRDAQPHYETVLAARPDDPDALIDIGLLQRSLGQLDEAERNLDRALSKRANDPRALAGKTDVLVSQSRADDAMSAIEQAIDRGVRHPDLAITYGRAAKSTKRYDDGIELIDTVLADPGLPRPYRATLNMVSGTLFEARGECDEAFARYAEGNGLYPATFNEDVYRRAMDELVEVFVPDKIATMATSSIDTSRAIFVLGMPRSGTSLVEQILACHPAVFGAGELGDVPRIISKLPAPPEVSQPYPFCLLEVSTSCLDALASAHLEMLAALAPEAQHVTDKLPQNYLHLGLISRLFPHAKVIHCQRDPLDNCLSCFATRLTPSHDYATNLRHLGIVYNEYLRIMDHWKKVLDLPILDVPYEAMVDDQEAMTHRLIEFCGLEWDDACLRFYESRRHAATASVDQVNQPIYRSSVARAERFAAHLDPLKDALAEGVRP